MPIKILYVSCNPQVLQERNLSLATRTPMKWLPYGTDLQMSSWAQLNIPPALTCGEKWNLFSLANLSVLFGLGQAWTNILTV